MLRDRKTYLPLVSGREPGWDQSHGALGTLARWCLHNKGDNAWPRRKAVHRDSGTEHKGQRGWDRTPTGGLPTPAVITPLKAAAPSFISELPGSSHSPWLSGDRSLTHSTFGQQGAGNTRAFDSVNIRHVQAKVTLKETSNCGVSGWVCRDGRWRNRCTLTGVSATSGKPGPLLDN